MQLREPRPATSPAPTTAPVSVAEPRPGPRQVAAVGFVAPPNYGAGVAWSGQVQIVATAITPTRSGGPSVSPRERIRALLHLDVVLPMLAALIVVLVLLAWAP